jgi:hypothetical protein
MSGQLIGDLLSVGGKVQQERDRLKSQLAESERLRQEAFATCEQMRQELVTLDARVQQVQDLHCSEFDAIEREATHSEDADATLNAIVARIHGLRQSVIGSHLPNREQLDAEIVRLTNNWSREIDERKAMQAQVAELQAQLEAAAVTPAQQPDGTHACAVPGCRSAEQLDRVRRLIGDVCGWYACVDWFDEVERTDSWEHAGALLGRLQREVG